MLGVDREWALALAIRTVADFHLRGILIKWAQNGAALSAVELEVFELGKHASTHCHDARHADKVIQVARAEVA